MGVAAVAGVAEVVSLVAQYAPQLINDVTSLSDLYSNASTAIANAAPDGTILPADWATLRATETALRATLDLEAAAAATVSGAA
jgi:hypothetical protein